MTTNERFATQIVGSYYKPQWLADHELVYAKEGVWWRVAPEFLETAHAEPQFVPNGAYP